jgi:hypothetical protein
VKERDGWVFDDSRGGGVAPLISKYIWPRAVREAVYAVEVPTTPREMISASLVTPLDLLAIPGIYRWTSSKAPTFTLGYAEGYAIAVAVPMRLTRQRALVRWELVEPTVEVLRVGRRNTRLRLNDRTVSVPNAVAPDLIDMLNRRPEAPRGGA